MRGHFELEILKAQINKHKIEENYQTYHFLRSNLKTSNLKRFFSAKLALVCVKQMRTHTCVENFECEVGYLRSLKYYLLQTLISMKIRSDLEYDHRRFFFLI